MTDPPEDLYVETEIEQKISDLYRQRAKLEPDTVEYENVMAQLRILQKQEAARMVAKHNADFEALASAYDKAVQRAKKLLGET